MKHRSWNRNHTDFRTIMNCEFAETVIIVEPIFSSFCVIFCLLVLPSSQFLWILEVQLFFCILGNVHVHTYLPYWAWCCIQRLLFLLTWADSMKDAIGFPLARIRLNFKILYIFFFANGDIYSMNQLFANLRFPFHIT